MRKALVITALLLVCSIGGLTAAALWVDAPRAEVVLTETVLSGDPAAAEGLEISQGTTLNNQLFWDTVLRPGARAESETAYAFTVKKTYAQGESDYSSLQLYDHVEYGSGAFRDNGEPLGLDKVYKELYEQSAADGQEHKRRVYLKDYYDYYPIALTFDTPDCHVQLDLYLYGYSDMEEAEPGTEAYAFQKLQDFFRIPVLEDEQMELQVSVQGNGSSYGGGSVEGSDSFDLWAYSVLTEGVCYFTFDPHTYQGNTVDLSLIPGGYGLYRLPYDPERRSEDGQELCPLDMDALEMVYPLDPSVRIVDLRTDPEKENLLLLTGEGDSCVLTVIRAETMETVQRLVLWDDPDISGWLYHDGGDFLLMSQSRQTEEETWERCISLLARRADGSYELRFTVPMELDEKLEYFRDSGLAAAYDGERLALVYPGWGYDRNRNLRENCGLVTAVYDETGLRYLGDWQSSLNTGYSQVYSYYCRCDSLSVLWK
ncbi:MAG: hypothetical protein ACI4PC_05670 [Oscillospiraceae bacterium]